jgi:hypothetical protein
MHREMRRLIVVLQADDWRQQGGLGLVFSGTALQFSGFQDRSSFGALPESQSSVISLVRFQIDWV